MEHKCLYCGTEMNVYNQIKLDMIDNPYVGQILFECPNCRHYRRSAFPILSIFEAREAIEAGTPILECDNFDDFLKKLEEMAWNSHVEHWNELEDNKWKMFCDGGRTVIRFPKTVLLDLQEEQDEEND